MLSTGFEAPSHDALIAEQVMVQAGKFQGRQLDEYNGNMFPGQLWRDPSSSAVEDFVRPFVGGNVITFEAVLRGIHETRPERPINWFDMGGGRALPMRQLACSHDIKTWLQMTNVDLFDFGLNNLKAEEIDYLEELTPGMTKPEAEPGWVNGNIETVLFPEPADVITSIEVMPYLNNPLVALANWYNQLADNGIMIVAARGEWASWIRYQGEPRGEEDEAPTKHLFEALEKNGINCAVTNKADRFYGCRPITDPTCFRIMAVQKKPGTALRVSRPVTEVWINPMNFKTVYYAEPSEGTSIVEVVSPTAKSIGDIALRPIG